MVRVAVLVLGVRLGASRLALEVHQHEQRVVHDAQRAQPAAVVVDLLLELVEH